MTAGAKIGDSILKSANAASGAARSERLARLLVGTSSLPTLAEVPLRVLALLDEPDVSLADVCVTVERDPMLSARLLRLANSPLFGRGQRLEGVRQAIVRLGYGELRTAVTTIGFIDSLGLDSRIFDMREIFREAVCCAAISRRLATSVRKDPCAAYLGGLLHSIGEIVLGLCFHERFERCVLHSRRSLLPMAEAIQREFGFDAGEIGAHLLERWRMPVAVIDAIRYQNAPQDSPCEGSLAELVGAAYRTTRSLGIGIEWPCDSGIDWTTQTVEILDRVLPDADGDGYLKSCQVATTELEESISSLLPPPRRHCTPLLS